MAPNSNKYGLVQFPMVMGGIVPVVHLSGHQGRRQLVIDGTTLADIYLGKITKWNDAALKALNPGVNLPEQGHRRGPPLRRIGHDLQLHLLPVRRQPGLEERRRHRQVGAVAGRHRLQGQ